jgi:hypothetical protein
MAEETEHDGSHVVHLCWKCSKPFDPYMAEYCPECGTLLCPSGHCLCDLGEEARRAVENEITSLGLWENSPSGRRKRRHARFVEEI